MGTLFLRISSLVLGTLLATGATAQQTDRDRRIAELKARELAQSTAVVKGRCIDERIGEFGAAGSGAWKRPNGAAGVPGGTCPRLWRTLPAISSRV